MTTMFVDEPVVAGPAVGPDDDIRDRVDRGAAFLDATHPGWAGRINLNVLRMSHCMECVLGQLYGDYDEGVERLSGVPFLDDGAEYWAIGHGFLTNDHSWGRLYWLWVAEIRSRRGDA